MPEIPDYLDVFRRPHYHMKQLVKDIERELLITNFCDSAATHSMLAQLLSRFNEFKTHEDIENQYIVKVLMPRLPSNSNATLVNDLHSDNKLNELVRLVDSGLELWEMCGRSERELEEYGERLKTSISNFNLDFIPHMDEEEKVFLPLLLEHFSESELRGLTLRMLELHHLTPSPPPVPRMQTSPAIQNDSDATPSLLSLPLETLLNIFSHLDPLDLLHLVHVHSALGQLAMDGSLWTHIHPVRWSCGHCVFFKPPDVDNQELLSNGLVEENDVTKELLTVGVSVNANLLRSNFYGDVGDDGEGGVLRELSILRGVIEHLLPRVGPHVRTLDLSHGKAISNEIVYRMLKQCPNLTYLDLSSTRISDFAFKGLLCKNHRRWNLKYVDLTGCSMITDLTLQRLAQSFSSSTSSHLTPSTSYSLLTAAQWNDRGGGSFVNKSQLKCLILSGCHCVTDVGLRYLAAGSGLPMLQYLNLSGLPNVTQKGLSSLVATSPKLPPDLLFYCDHIMAGPYPETANGCLNVSNTTNIQCCRMRM